MSARPNQGGSSGRSMSYTTLWGTIPNCSLTGVQEASTSTEMVGIPEFSGLAAAAAFPRWRCRRHSDGLRR